MRTLKKSILFVGMLFLFASPKVFSQMSTASSSLFAPQITPSFIDSVIYEVIDYGKNFLGKPYRYRPQSGVMFDCSGFLQFIFNSHSLDIPRTSRSIGEFVDKIDIDQVQEGDFLFFKGRNTSVNTIGHLSVVVGCDSSGLKMMHSCRRGIVIDDFPRSYYGQRFLYAGRLPVMNEMVNTTPPDTLLSRAQIRKLIEEDDTITPVKKSVNIIGVGDIMLGTNFPSDSYLPPNDGKDLLKPVDSILNDADITFGNLEGVILTGEGDVKKCGDPKNCYAFKSPDHYLTYLKDAGFDVLSISNNHVGDFGNAGRTNTIKRLAEEEIAFAGLLDYPFTTFEKDSMRYGFVAFSPNTGTVRINEYERAKEIVQHLDTITDIVIVSFHGGAEGSSKSHITKETEIFLGENRGNPHEFARLVIDAGADIVFGHGPHVTRAIDLYKDRFIAYSLGNFATYGRFNLRGINGIAPIIKVTTNDKGVFEKAQIIPVKQVGEGGPQIDESSRVIKEIIQLNTADLPECELVISSDGSVVKITLGEVTSD
jgi:poly-gamma-glutamate capsule biosynthesis protein CapA/YwtB (metallophosphatase superfamily)